MKKNVKVKLLLIVMILFFVLVGCHSNTTDVASTKISKEVTGIRDLTTRLYEGIEETIIVYGTSGSEMNTTHLKWLGEAQMNVWGAVFGKKLENMNIKSDTEVTDEDIKNKNIILLGNPKTNSFYERVNEYLTIKVDGDKLLAGDKVFDKDTVTYNFAVPNPLNKNKYLWVFGATNSENFVNTISGSPIHDYEIKIDGNEKYAGEFVKGEYEWSLDSSWKNVYKEDGMTTTESEHFVFHYPAYKSNALEDIDKIVENYEAAYQNIMDKLNMTIDRKIDYYLFNNKKTMFTYRDADDIENRWLGQISVIYDGKDENTQYKKRILSTVEDYYGKPLNFFTWTGIYDIAFPEENHDYTIDKLKSVINSADYILVENLIMYKTHHYDNVEISNLESIFLSRYLIEEYGVEKYLDFYKANQTKEADKSIEEVYGKNGVELEEEWLRYIEEGSGND